MDGAGQTRTAVLHAAFPRFEIREGGKDDAWAAQANGKNGVWRVWVWSGIDNRAAVAAQEVYEWRFRILAGLGAAIAVGGLTGALAAVFEPLLWWLVPLSTWAAFVLIPQLHIVQLRKELMSHEVEAQAAALLYGVDVAAYRAREAGGMLAYPWLRDMSKEEIVRRMEANAGNALLYVRRRLRFFTAIRDFSFGGAI